MGLHYSRPLSIDISSNPYRRSLVKWKKDYDMELFRQCQTIVWTLLKAKIYSPTLLCCETILFHFPWFRYNLRPLLSLWVNGVFLLAGRKLFPPVRKQFATNLQFFCFLLPFVPFFLFFLHRVLFMALHSSFTFLLCCVCGKVFTLLYPCILRGRFCSYSTYLGLEHT